MLVSMHGFESWFDFTGRTIVVTGGTGVLGRVFVSALLQAGANIALIVRDPEKARTLFPEHVAPRERLLVIAANVTDPDSLKNARAQCLDQFTHIDALINGIGGN